MKRGMALIVATFLLFGASGVWAASADIEFILLKGEFCQTTTATTGTVTFADPGVGVDTATQSGTLGLECTSGASPDVTVTGDGASPGFYDFSGTMVSGPTNHIHFTGVWTATPPGAGIGTPTPWTFDVTALGLILAPSGAYSRTLTFTITP